MRVVPADEARPLLLELLLDVVPQPRHHVARAIAVDRLVQAQRDVDHEVGDAALGALAFVAEQEAEDALARTVRRRHVLVNRREGGLRQEHGKGDVAGPLGTPIGGAPQDRPADRNRLTQWTGGGHCPKIRRLVEVVEVGGGQPSWTRWERRIRIRSYVSATSPPSRNR